jgi:dTDP-4-amino-4,6-dideoxygalactose transaminase
VRIPQHGSRILTSSGTAALVPSYTFFATVTPLLHLDAVPVLAESDETGNLDPKDVARRITTKTKALVVTHMWGLPADMPALKAIVDEHDLILRRTPRMLTARPSTDNVLAPSGRPPRSV